MATGADSGRAWREALGLFETGQYFACHEALEGAWLSTGGLRRELYGGLILLAAALHKTHTQGHREAALKRAKKAIAVQTLIKFDPFRASCKSR